MFWDLEFRHQFVVIHHALNDLQAHLMNLRRRVFDLFDLRQRELVISIFTPVGFAIHGVEVEAKLRGFFAPVRALVNG